MVDALTCPLCGGEVRPPEGDDGIYRDGEEYDVSCLDCGAELTVEASVEVTFTKPAAQS